jgi:hypothetical protein
MKKIFFILITVLSMAHTQVLNISYIAKFGILGKVGRIDNKIIINNNKYTIDTTLRLYGIAKMLLSGQKEHYISKGKITNGYFVPDFYSMSTIKKHKKLIKKYYFDHQKHIVTRIKKKYRDGKITDDSKIKLKVYAKDDLLTLYFNMDRHIKAHNNQKSFTLNVAGLEKQKGKVKITQATSGDIAEYKDELGSSYNWYAKALIVQKSFKNKKGDIFLSVSRDGYIKKAVIKDLVMYGDAILLRTQ